MGLRGRRAELDKSAARFGFVAQRMLHMHHGTNPARRFGFVLNCSSLPLRLDALGG